MLSVSLVFGHVTPGGDGIIAGFRGGMSHPRLIMKFSSRYHQTGAVEYDMSHGV